MRSDVNSTTPLKSCPQAAFVVAASVSDSKSSSCNVDGEVEESGEGTLSLSVAILSIFMPWRVGNDYNDSVDTSLFLILSIPISSYSSPPPLAATTNYLFIAALNVNSVIIIYIIVMDEKVLLLLFLFSFRFFHSNSKVTGEQIIYVEMTTEFIVYCFSA
ncbi:MAG: hypothetical protein WBV84_03390 [Nitrososphaeraceae archaeon]